MTDNSKGDYKSLDLIQDAMGTMGPWQIVIAVALSFINFPVAFHQLSIPFLAPAVDFRCADPVILNGSIPELNKCNYPVTQYEHSQVNLEQCTVFTYESAMDTTIISQWNLVCDRSHMANVVQSMTMFGIFIGNMVFGILADRIGRKTPFMIAIVVQFLTGLLVSFMPSYELFLLFKFISAVATGGTMLISFVILMEIVGTEWRSKIAVLFHIPFIFGIMLISLVAYFTRTWDKMLMILSFPPVLLLSYYWLVPESPRWLLATGKIKKARRILNAAAKRNNIPVEKVNLAIESHENKETKETEENEGTERTYSVIDLFRTPNMRMKTICIAFNWLVCGISFFGLGQYLGKIPGDLFVNIAVIAAFGLPGILIVYFLISRVSRLKILISGNVTAAVSLLLLIATSNNIIVQILLAAVGNCALSISFTTIYLYTGEIFPTVVRNNGFGLCGVCSKIGSMVAPFLIGLEKVGFWLPPFLLGIGPLIGAVLCLFLPETMNCTLPETLEDGENFKKQKRVSSSAIPIN